MLRYLEHQRTAPENACSRECGIANAGEMLRPTTPTSGDAQLERSRNRLIVLHTCKYHVPLMHLVVLACVHITDKRRPWHCTRINLQISCIWAYQSLL